MTMANRFEWLGTGSDSTALALTLYTGWFNEAPRTGVFLWDTTLPFIKRTTVSAGKSHQFIMDADTPDAEEFLPGEEMLGQTGANQDGTITVDKFLVAHKFIPEDQMAISHYSILEDVARKHKFALSRMYDKRIFTVAALGARASSVTKNGLTVHNGGNRVPRTAATLAAAYPTSATGAANLIADMRSLAYESDIDFLDGDARYAFLPPYLRQVAQYDASAQLFSEDYVDPDTNRIQQRKIMQVAGFKILGFPNYTSASGPLPNQNIVDPAGSKYSGNFTVQASNGPPAVLAMCASGGGDAGIGLVTYRGIQNRLIYQPERMGYLAYSFVLCGVGQLHPWCLGSVEVQTT